MYGFKTLDDWNLHDSVHDLFTRYNESLKVQKRKLHAAISREFSGHSESKSLADALLDASDLCWENINYDMEGFYCMIVKTMYGNR